MLFNCRNMTNFLFAWFGVFSNEIRTRTKSFLFFSTSEIPLKFPDREKKPACQRRPRTFSRSGGHALGGVVVRPCLRQKWMFFTFQKLYSFLYTSSHSIAPGPPLCSTGVFAIFKRKFPTKRRRARHQHTSMAAARLWVRIFIYLLLFFAFFQFFTRLVKHGGLTDTRNIGRVFFAQRCWFFPFHIIRYTQVFRKEG